MRGQRTSRRFLGVAVAILLLVGSGSGVAILWFAALSSAPPEPGRVGDSGAATPIAAGLVSAIRNADAQVIRQLLAGGADVNGRDEEGNTPLILASLYADPECVEILIENPAQTRSGNAYAACPSWAIIAADCPAR
jgi:hypothetical protein